MNLQESSLQLCRALAASYHQKAKLIGKDPALALLHAAAASGDSAVLAAVCPFAFAEQKDRQRLALEAINQLPSISNEHLARFDAWFREECSTWFYPPGTSGPSRWYQLEREELTDLLNAYGAKAHRAILLCTCHPSGYVRQRALDLAAAAGIAELVPYSLVRLNDWVPAVREAASRGIDHWLKTDSLPNFLPVLPLVSRLSHCYRTDHRKILRTMAEHLQRGPSREQLLAGMRDPAASVRAICYGMALEEGVPDSLRHQAIEIGLSDPLAHLRMRAANKAKEFGLEFADQMLADTFMPIRRVGLELQVEARTESHQTMLEQGLDDPHPSMRDFSRYWLRTLGYREDFASHYRLGLTDASPRSSRIALSGLGETGTAEDCSSIVPFLEHEGVRHREAAVRSLSALDFDAHRNPIIARVLDSSARVSRAATNTILASQTRLVSDELAPLLMSDAVVHGRVHAFRLIARLSKWERIRCLLDALHDSEKEAAVRFVDGVSHWLFRYNESFIQPSSEQLSEVVSSFASAEAQLPFRLRRSLAALFGSLH